MSIRILALVIGLVLNALGNGLTVATNVGTSPWTASEVNIGNLIHTTVGIPMFCVGVLVAITNQLLIHQWDKWRFFGEIGFIACFSYFVDVFVALFTRLGVPGCHFLSGPSCVSSGWRPSAAPSPSTSGPTWSCTPTTIRPTSSASSTFITTSPWLSWSTSFRRSSSWWSPS